MDFKHLQKNFKAELMMHLAKVQDYWKRDAEGKLLIFSQDGKKTFTKLFGYNDLQAAGFQNPNKIDLKDDWFWVGIEQGEIAKMTPLYYRLPAKTIPFFAGRNAWQKVDNLHLLINKLVPFKNGQPDETEDNRFKDKFELKYNLTTKDKNLLGHCQQVIKDNFNTTFQGQALRLEMQARMVVGMGEDSIYENSMTLHPVYGIPYIPATAIKGVCRSWIITQCYSHIEEGKEEKAMQNPFFTFLFGDTNQQGNLTFFDAFPLHSPKIERDIINVHYQEYYSEGKAPGDYLSPIPNTYITLAPTAKEENINQAFDFYVGFNANHYRTRKALQQLQHQLAEEKETQSNLLTTALLPENWEGVHPIESEEISSFIHHWLEEALCEHGIGAKSAVGYGFFRR